MTEPLTLPPPTEPLTKKKIAAGPADEIAVLAKVSKLLDTLSPAQRSWAMAFISRKFGPAADGALPPPAAVDEDGNVNAPW